ncbi:ATP-dependent helicase [[Clostridium] fimetarium]|nr:ATP-dependent helicase [[Clostridium] fimetarium]
MKSNEFFNKYNVSLNEQQMEAVQTVDGPVLLLAVPGSGKTTVLVTRIGYMIYCCKIHPERILTLTYTKAATIDMSERYCSIFGNEMQNRLEFRTINGICAKVIQYYGRRIGKKAYELITNEKIIGSILLSIYRKYLDEYPTESDIKGLRALITYIKNMMFTDKEIEDIYEQDDLHISDIYREYCSELKSRSLMDYDDQMIYAYNMLKGSSEILQYFQEQYPYICVDEAQDTSKIQHAIIALLVKTNGNLFMVGDEDQSIYGFRAAYPEALLDFKKTHSNGKVLLMEKNFRSNAKIVLAADRFIQKNKMRHEKHMVAARCEESDINLIPITNRCDQYAYLVKVAQECESTTAVLYRDNESVLPLVDLLEKRHIPYRIKNADFTFFSHRSVLDVQNIMRFAIDPYDPELFMQIYYKIRTYLNKATAIKICEISAKRQITVLDVAIEYGYLAENTKKSCKSMKTHLRLMNNERAEKAIRRIVDSMGYGDYLERQNIKDSKIFILKSIAENESTPQAFISRLNELAQIIKEKENDSDCKFILSTIHSSKGLEYDNVYLMDVCDGVFPENVRDPKSATPEEMKEYEEERRLFYVGVTRAKNTLCIFKSDYVSTFCNELLNTQAITPVAISKKPSMATVARNSSYNTAPSSFDNSESLENYKQFCEDISQKKTVKHKVFGIGEVISHDIEHITIRFGVRERMLSLRSMYELELLV